MDRIRACVYWHSTADCEWASRMMAMHEDSMDWGYLEKQARQYKTIFEEARNSKTPANPMVTRVSYS